MDPVAELVKQGLLGIIAGIFLWLYLREVARHDSTRQQKDALMEARRVDAQENLEKIEAPLSLIAQTTKFIADKLVIAKRTKV